MEMFCVICHKMATFNVDGTSNHLNIKDGGIDFDLDKDHEPCFTDETMIERGEAAIELNQSQITFKELKSSHLRHSTLWNVGKSKFDQALLTVIIDGNGNPIPEKTELFATLKLVNAEAERLRQQRDDLVKQILK